ncbi:N-acyl homoserine lactonase family protein [Cryptosporangium sp. NPDC048952]|uniref:N-acyl homoserine lactonase family protein n=1 Tax=Cryptosporangium sp. NPDC048952 TaxID=3363961 RepID=UPI00371B9D7E
MTYEVLAVRFGEWRTTKSAIYHSYGTYQQPDGPVDITYYVWLLRGNDRTILVDTGFRPEIARKRGRTPLTPVPDALASVGVTPGDITDVVLTHFHYDHIGNVHLFPDARIVAGAAEYHFWTGETGRRPLFAQAVEADEVAAVAAAEKQRRLTLGDPGIPGLTLTDLPGHTPGQVVVEVDTAAGRVILASDASHTYEEFESDLPFHIASDLPAMYDGLAWLRKAATDSIVVPGHDPDVLNRYPKVGDHAVRIA